MALSKEDKAEIVEIIQASMHRECLCGISAETQQEMGHFFGRVKDLGNGNLNIGIERFSKAVSLMAKVRGTGERIGGQVAVWLSIAVIGGLLTIIGLGIRTMVQNWKG